MTSRLTDDELSDARERAFWRRQERETDKIERREREAEHLIGELCREGKTGRPTGRTKEGMRVDLIAYLLRNNYV